MLNKSSSQRMLTYAHTHIFIYIYMWVCSLELLPTRSHNIPLLRLLSSTPSLCPGLHGNSLPDIYSLHVFQSMRPEKDILNTCVFLRPRFVHRETIPSMFSVRPTLLITSINEKVYALSSYICSILDLFLCWRACPLKHQLGNFQSARYLVDFWLLAYIQTAFPVRGFPCSYAAVAASVHWLKPNVHRMCPCQLVGDFRTWIRTLCSSSRPS